MPLGHVVDEITDGADRMPDRCIGKRESTARQPEFVVERLDTKALSRNAQLVERVTERRGFKLRGAHNIGIGHSVVSNKCS